MQIVKNFIFVLHFCKFDNKVLGFRSFLNLFISVLHLTISLATQGDEDKLKTCEWNCNLIPWCNSFPSEQQKYFTDGENMTAALPYLESTGSTKDIFLTQRDFAQPGTLFDRRDNHTDWAKPKA